MISNNHSVFPLFQGSVMSPSAATAAAPGNMPLVRNKKNVRDEREREKKRGTQE